MSPTAKTLWVPGVSMLFCSFVLLLAMTHLVPPATWVDPKGPVLLMAPWLLSYLVFGALGSWWSRRAGGSTATRFFSGMFPLALHLAVFLVPIVVAMASNLHRFPEHVQVSFLYGVDAQAFEVRAGLGWVVIPGIALAVGTVPFLKQSSQEPGRLRTT